MPTKIEWADEVWNPITGCTPVSEGCRNCYARRMANRLAGRFGYPSDDPFRPGMRHFGEFKKPLRWKKPRRVFVCSMGDIFHDRVRNEDIDEVMGAILACAYLNGYNHTFMLLTKRPDRAACYFSERKPAALIEEWSKTSSVICVAEGESRESGEKLHDCLYYYTQVRCDKDFRVIEDSKTPWTFLEELWPLKNLHIGVSVENQKTADERIPSLLQIPAAVRFVSYEPALGPVDFGRWFWEGTAERWSACGEPIDCDVRPVGMIHGVIAGGESGPGARPAHPDWFRSVRGQCADARVPFFFKSWGDYAIDSTPDVPDKRQYHVPSGIGDGRGIIMRHVGKRDAGRLLDGREHNELPGVKK